MNKLTSTLAGLALVAGASVAPALAQGSFTNNNVPFTFSFVPGTSLTVTNVFVTFNPTSGTPSTGFLSITATGASGSNFFSNVSETYTPSPGMTASTPNPDTSFSGVFVNQNPVTGLFDIASNGASTNGNSFDLAPGTPVPEASTTVSFGALLALGGLAVVLRRKSLKNAA
jgi:hypothetical protein